MAQEMTPVVYTDPTTGIVFDTWVVPDQPADGQTSGSATSGGLTWGVALPSDALTTDATEFIGYLVSRSRPRLSPYILIIPSNVLPRTQRKRVGAVYPWEVA